MDQTVLSGFRSFVYELYFLERKNMTFDKIYKAEYAAFEILLQSNSFGYKGSIYLAHVVNKNCNHRSNQTSMVGMSALYKQWGMPTIAILKLPPFTPND